MIATEKFFERKNDAWDCALMAAIPSHYIPYDGMDIYRKNEHNLTLCCDQDLESFLIKKDLFNALSSDAHYLIKAIDENATEISTPKTGNITKNSIQRFLMKNHWSKRKISKTMIEIQGFLIELNSL